MTDLALTSKTAQYLMLAKKIDCFLETVHFQS